MVKFIGRMVIALCGVVCFEFFWLILISAIVDGPGAEGLSKLLFWFLFGSIIVAPVSFYHCWRLTTPKI